MEMFINKQHPARAFWLRRGWFWHISFSRQPFQKKIATLHLSSGKAKWQDELSSVNVIYGMLHIYFFPCLTSSSSFFRIHRNLITYNFIPNMIWMLDFCTKMNEFPIFRCIVFLFTWKLRDLKRKNEIISEISNEHTSLLHPKVKLHNFYTDNFW